jgi:hypothetical protein
MAEAAFIIPQMRLHSRIWGMMKAASAMQQYDAHPEKELL